MATDATTTRPAETNGQNPTDTLPGLLAHHVAELRASGLSDETIKASGVHSEDAHSALDVMLGWGGKLPKKMAPAIVFPYTAIDGRNSSYARIKPDTPRKQGGKVTKYESPRKQPNQLYIPPGVADVFDRPEAELLFTEGEKKSLCVTQYGFACIGLVGVYGWKESRREALLPAMAHIIWKGRSVTIVFDSDIATNPQVKDAAMRLAAHLEKRGAKVKIAYLPAAGDDKVGADDFLIAHGAAAFRKVIDQSQEPEPVEGAAMKEKASSLDPSTEAKAILDEGLVDGVSKLRYHRGGWIRWSLGSYRDMMADELRAHVNQLLDRNYYKLNQSITSNVVDQLKAKALLPFSLDEPAWIGEDGPWPAREVLSTKGALIHLPTLVTGEADYHRPPTPRFFCSSSLGYKFDIDAPKPAIWLQFLGELFGDDAEAAGLLQEWIGYLLTLDTRQQKIAMLIGPPRSGKGVITRVIHKLVGEANTVAPTLAGLATNFGLWPLLGKSVAIVSDARMGGRVDSSIVCERLLSISGEDALTVDRKNLQPVTGKLPTRLMIVSNELPRFADASGALAGRMLILRLKQSFYGREDQGLTDRLLGELPGILLWAVAGWARLRERGHFVQPASGDELRQQMEDITSPVGEFVRTCCQLDPAFVISIDEIYEAWKRWCETTGRKNVGARQMLGRDLLACLPKLRTVQRRDANQERFRGYEGIRVREDF
jgi:putative DNA primase/helicase